MTSELHDFVASRLPMVAHAIRESRIARQRDAASNARAQMARYSVQQGFFYVVDDYVAESPLVSARAANYIEERYGTAAESFWGVRRAGLPRFEKSLARENRQSYSKLDIIYEHIFTGTMFWNALVALDGAGQLEVGAVVALIRSNYRTAWVHRDEDGVLPQSNRGKTLTDALGWYTAKQISLLTAKDQPFEFPAVAKPFTSASTASGRSRVDLVAATTAFVASQPSDLPVVQVGDASGPLATPRSRQAAAFIPAAWSGLVRRAPSSTAPGHWKSGLPLLFWFESTDDGLRLIAEVGPWPDAATRAHLTSRLQALPWTRSNKGGDTYWRFWMRKQAWLGGDPQVTMNELWAELADDVGDVGACLSAVGLLDGEAPQDL